mmetsp:Transcript_72813/g.115699  ORF Transcript_72813/g.115699 Transcript_72813/m.115699 type:complete len:231 (+) Transcript_72813:1774-2466(+)
MGLSECILNHHIQQDLCIWEWHQGMPQLPVSQPYQLWDCKQWGECPRNLKHQKVKGTQRDQEVVFLQPQLLPCLSPRLPEFHQLRLHPEEQKHLCLSRLHQHIPANRLQHMRRQLVRSPRRSRRKANYLTFHVTRQIKTSPPPRISVRVSSSWTTKRVQIRGMCAMTWEVLTPLDMRQSHPWRLQVCLTWTASNRLRLNLKHHLQQCKGWTRDSRRHRRRPACQEGSELK